MIGGLRLRLIRLRPDPYPHCGDLCAWDRPSRKRGGCCVSCARRAHPRAALSTSINNRAHLSLDDPVFDATFAPSRSRQGAFARHCDGRTGCGVPRVCEMHANSREAPGTRPPPLRADAISAFTRVFDALWSSQTVKPTCFIPRGTGPITAAVERREASIPDGVQGASQAPAGVRHSPAEGCRCTRAPVGAPLPSFVMRGNMQTSEDKCLARTMMRARKS